MTKGCVLIKIIISTETNYKYQGDKCIMVSYRLSQTYVARS